MMRSRSYDSPLEEMSSAGQAASTVGTPPTSKQVARRPIARRSSFKNLERVDYRTDSRLEFHLVDEQVPELTTFGEYCAEILGPSEDGEDELDKTAIAGRKKVYNLLFKVPWQLERVMLFGALVSLDTFLTIFAMVPFRACRALVTVTTALARCRRKEGLSGEALRTAGVTQEDVCDVAWVTMIAAGVAVLLSQNVSITYHTIRGQEFVKLYVLFNLLEVFEKLCCSFGADALDAISHSAGQLLTASSSFGWHRRLGVDVLIGVMVVTVHSLIILMQAITFNVAVNSRSNQLLALLISNNFIEMKSAVFKKWDTKKHFQLVMQDVYERCHLTVCFTFVALEMFSKGGQANWVGAFGSQIVPLALFELFVDHMKHGFVCKYNDIPPSVFRDYLAELCRRTTHFSAFKMHRLLEHEPLALTCVLVRALLTVRYSWVPWNGLKNATLSQAAVKMLQICTIYALLLGLKLVVGWCTQNLAVRYMTRHRRKYPHLYVIDATTASKMK